MRKIITIFTILIQVVSTFTLMFFMYMIFAFIDSDFGMEGVFGLIVFQPIFAIILTIITVILCFIIGLPIRLSISINSWWIKHFYIAIIGVVFGIVLIVLSLLPDYMETIQIEKDGEIIIKQIPNISLSIFGWFLTAFSILHIYPPKIITNKIEEFFEKKL